MAGARVDNVQRQALNVVSGRWLVGSGCSGLDLRSKGSGRRAGGRKQDIMCPILQILGHFAIYFWLSIFCYARLHAISLILHTAHTQLS